MGGPPILVICAIDHADMNRITALFTDNFKRRNVVVVAIKKKYASRLPHPNKRFQEVLQAGCSANFSSKGTNNINGKNPMPQKIQ